MKRGGPGGASGQSRATADTARWSGGGGSSRRRLRRRRLRRRRRKLTQAYPQHKLISKVRDGAKVSKKHDTAATPFHRATDHPTMAVERIVALTRTYSLISPAATQRQIQALTTQLFTHDHQQSWTHHQSPSSQARTFT